MAMLLHAVLYFDRNYGYTYSDLCNMSADEWFINYVYIINSIIIIPSIMKNISSEAYASKEVSSLISSLYSIHLIIFNPSYIRISHIPKMRKHHFWIS